MLEAEPLTGSAQRGLNFIGNEKSAVFSAQFLGGGKVIIGRVFNAFALDGFENESGDIAGAEFGFEISEIAKFDETRPWKEGIEVLAEITGVGDRESSKGKAVIGAFLCEDFRAFGGGTGKFQGSFDRFCSRVAEEAGIARGA